MNDCSQEVIPQKSRRSRSRAKTPSDYHSTRENSPDKSDSIGGSEQEQDNDSGTADADSNNDDNNNDNNDNNDNDNHDNDNHDNDVKREQKTPGDSSGFDLTYGNVPWMVPRCFVHPESIPEQAKIAALIAERFPLQVNHARDYVARLLDQVKQEMAQQTAV